MAFDKNESDGQDEKSSRLYNSQTNLKDKKSQMKIAIIFQKARLSVLQS